jgi:hypothetical protein
MPKKFSKDDAFGHFGVNRQFSGSTLMLAMTTLSSRPSRSTNDSVAVEGRIGDQGAEAETVYQRRHNGVVPMAGRQDEAHEIGPNRNRRNPQNQDTGRRCAWCVLLPRSSN